MFNVYKSVLFCAVCYYSVAGLWAGGLRCQGRVRQSSGEALGALVSSCLLLSIQVLDGPRINLKKVIAFV